MSADTRSRAAVVLGVPVDVTSEAAMSAFLAGLPVSEFVPNGEAVAAINTHAGLAIPVESDTPPTLRDEIEEFAKRYWLLTPAKRMATWLAFVTRSPDDATAERLLALQAGLDLPRTPFPDTASEELLALIRELYLLSPRERAIRRNEWLLANSTRHTDLVAVAAAILKDQPAFAALDPILFERLSSNFDARLFAEAATTPSLHEPPNPAEPIVYTPPPSLPSPPTPREPPASPRERWNWVIDWALDGILRWSLVTGIFLGVISVVAFNLAMMQSEAGKKPRSPTPFGLPQNPFSLPQTPSPPNTTKSGSTITISVDQIRECEEYEKRSKSQKEGKKQAPLNYVLWVLVGKPKSFQFPRGVQMKIPDTIPGAR